MKSKGRIVFLIRDKELDFKNISTCLKIEPTKITTKGQFVTSSRIAKFDVWRYEKIYMDINNISMVLEELIDELLKKQKYIITLLSQYDYVGITCYVVSELGQIGISLTEAVIKKLNALGIGVNFDIISYGEVEN